MLAQISARAINKICCCKEHIFHGEKVKLSELGRRRCSRILRITYYRKYDSWNCSFNQLCSATKISSQGNKEQILWRIPLTCSFSSTVIFEKSLCDHFRTLLALYPKEIVGSWQWNLGYIDSFSRLILSSFLPALLSLRKFLCDHFQRLFALYSKNIVRNF